MRTTYPSGYATDGIRLSTSGAAESFRFDRSPNRDNVYINVYSPESMEEAIKNNENEGESEQIQKMEYRLQELENRHYEDLKRNDANFLILTNRIKTLEEHLTSLDHTHEQGNDIRDGGWFD